MLPPRDKSGNILTFLSGYKESWYVREKQKSLTDKRCFVTSQNSGLYNPVGMCSTDGHVCCIPQVSGDSMGHLSKCKGSFAILETPNRHNVLTVVFVVILINIFLTPCVCRCVGVCVYVCFQKSVFLTLYSVLVHFLI